MLCYATAAAYLEDGRWRNKQGIIYIRWKCVLFQHFIWRRLKFHIITTLCYYIERNLHRIALYIYIYNTWVSISFYVRAIIEKNLVSHEYRRKRRTKRKKKENKKPIQFVVEKLSELYILFFVSILLLFCCHPKVIQFNSTKKKSSVIIY